MTHTKELIVEDVLIDILVSYDWERGESQIEQYVEVGNRMYTKLTSVEVIIKGRAIDILPKLTIEQENAIIDRLNYDKYD